MSNKPTKKKPTKKKPTKKLTKKKLLSMARTAKRKNLSEWSKQIRLRDNECLVCGKKDNLNAHHILPKEHYPELMLEILNGVTLCPRHHKFGKYSAHKNPLWFSKIIQNLRAEQYEWAINNMGDET